MDDSFQFIIESPQNSQGQKKRPRLVTSCDNCRLKKIKCFQPSPESKCEACKSAKIPCRFRDRERYFAERSRAIAGSNPGSYGDRPRGSLDAFPTVSYPHSSISRNSHSSRNSGGHSVSGTRYQSYSPDSSRPPELHHRQSSSTSSLPPLDLPRNNSIGFDYLPSLSPLPHTQPRHLQLFDPSHPQYPSPAYMPHFIQLFFDHLGAEFTFISMDETLRDYWNHSLPPLLANCIAAMGARFANLPDVTARDLHNAVETYTDNAENILTTVSHIPNIDTLYALIILSWSEYKTNRMSAFNTYCQMAMRMAMDLGLSDQSPIPPHLSETEKSRRRSTWASVVQLHLTASASSFR